MGECISEKNPEPQLTVEEAEAILSTATRDELRDHAFGDREVFWSLDGKEIAGGYFGSGKANVWVGSGYDDWEGRTGSFQGDEARRLSQAGTFGKVARNDETGPDNYVDGAIMPGLTADGVFRELTTQQQQKGGSHG